MPKARLLQQRFRSRDQLGQPHATEWDRRCGRVGAEFVNTVGIELQETSGAHVIQVGNDVIQDRCEGIEVLKKKWNDGTKPVAPTRSQHMPCYPQIELLHLAQAFHEIH